MDKIRLYIIDSYNELLNKVSWPTWDELRSSAGVVLIASLMIALVVYIMDQIFNGVLTAIYDFIKELITG